MLRMIMGRCNNCSWMSLLILSLYMCSSSIHVLSHKINVQSLPREIHQTQRPLDNVLTMSRVSRSSVTATGSVSISPRTTINISSKSNQPVNPVTISNTNNNRKGIVSHTSRSSQRSSISSSATSTSSYAPTFAFPQISMNNDRSQSPTVPAPPPPSTRRNAPTTGNSPINNQTESVTNLTWNSRASLLTDMPERHQIHHHNHHHNNNNNQHHHHQQHSLLRDADKNDSRYGHATNNMSGGSGSGSGSSSGHSSDSEDSWIRMWAPEVDSTEFKNNIMGGFLKREVWTIPLLAFASLNILLIVLFEVYVLCKARGPSRRHLFLGQMLLFGLFLCSAIALIFAICPSVTGCFLGRLGLGIAYSLIFSVLMVKCVFLLSLDSGVYLPASYQGFLLLFAVLVQVSIDTQWAIVYPPFLTGAALGGPLWVQCGSSYSHLLMTLSYIAFLIVVVGVLALKARGIRENYRESTYIGISILVSVPIWISWTVAGWILQGRHQDACVAFGLVAQSLATFLIMFMPKGRQLAAMGKEGMYLEDQEDQCSGYSPSFFHFKPSKTYKTALFGDDLSNGHFYRLSNNYRYTPYIYYPSNKTDGNVYTTLEPTISTINPNVFFHRSDFHPGMIY